MSAGGEVPYQVLPAEPVEDLDAYARLGGGTGHRRACHLGPEATIDVLARARLRGRGGGGYPVAEKWETVRAGARRRDDVAVVANGVEGEPGTYKDRLLLTRSPYAVVEGLLIAMHTIGAARGFLAVRRSSAPAAERTGRALDEMRAAGWPGADAIRLVTGPDDYLYGEETGLLEVIEGRPPLPRVLRPHECGLFARPGRANPAAVSNVETLAHVRAILADGPEPFLACGTPAAPGTMLFTVVGDVPVAGVHELPLGTPLRTLLDLAGADNVRAVFCGAGGVVTEPLLDTPLDADSMRAVGVELGSGGLVVVDSGRCVVQVLAVLVRFLALESCGQCVGCKVGTTEAYERLSRIERGQGTTTDLARIRSRVGTMADGARCRLPQGAGRLVASTMDAFPEAFTDHASASCPRPMPTPLVEGPDAATGELVWHPDYDNGVPEHARRSGMPR